MLKQINDLHIFRYSVTELGNVLSSRGFPLFSPATFTVTMSATYGQLIEHHLARLKKSIRPEAYNQVSRNHLTALRAFMRYHQRSEGTQPVGSLFLGLLSFGEAKESESPAGAKSRPPPRTQACTQA